MVKELHGDKVYYPYVRIPVIEVKSDKGLRWYTEAWEDAVGAEILTLDWAACRIGWNGCGSRMRSWHQDLVNLVVF